MELDKRIILDTDFLSHFLISKRLAILQLDELIKQGYSPVSTAISKGEMVFGAKKKGWGEKRTKKLLEMFNSLNTLPFTTSTSEIYGKIRAELVTKGIDIGFADTAIGSIALEHNCSVLTRNVRHFERITNLNVIPYNVEIKLQLPST